MSKTLKKNLIKCAIAMALSLLLVYVFVALRIDLSELSEVAKVDLYLVLCDAFTIPGLLMLMFALLFTISNQGALDGVGYLAVNAVKMLIPGAAANVERYREYLERRRANRAKGYGFLYICAGICFVFAAVFMVLFYSLYQK